MGNLLCEGPNSSNSSLKSRNTSKPIIDELYCTKNSPHAKNTTPGFRSILAGDGPQRGGGILNFPDFVPRIRYTWYALVFVIGVLSVLHHHLDLSVLCAVSLALKGNVARNEYYLFKITSISAFRRSNRGGRTCSKSSMT